MPDQVIQTDWLGIALTVTIILVIILLVWSKVTGDDPVDILSKLRDFVRGDR